MDVNVLHAEQRNGIRKQPEYRKTAIWPVGKRQPLTKALAAYFFDLLSTSEVSLLELLRKHPELPPFSQLDGWRASNKNGFSDQWKHAGELRAHYLVEKCLDLQHATNPKNAHAIRVKFDILKWIAAKLHPNQYGDKPTQPVTNVAIGFNITAERLNEIRSKLDVTREAYSNANRPQLPSNGNDNSNTSASVSGTPNSASVTPPLLTDSSTEPRKRP